MNPSHGAAKVYAQALIEVGEGSGALPQIIDDLEAIRELYDAEDPEFRAMFTSPRIEAGAKRAAVLKAFEGKVCREVLGLLAVLVEKRREALFDNIVDQFERLRDLREGRVHAYVESARPLDQAEVERLKQTLEEAGGKKVRVHETVEPALLAGIRVRVGDRVVDGTLRSRLHQLRNHLIATQE